jgi:hypothetical protein
MDRSSIRAPESRALSGVEMVHKRYGIVRLVVPINKIVVVPYLLHVPLTRTP